MVARRWVIRRAESQGDSILADEAAEQGDLRPLDSCIVASEKLLQILRAEARALKAFQKEQLLQLITEKEALATELANRMKSFGSSECITKNIDQQQSPSPGSAGIGEEESDDDQAKRGLLRGLLNEIMALNKRNHIFIQGSLIHWQQLLNLCLPSTYVPAADGQAARQSIPTKGLALNREI
jgi:flagellar biosynthesis/type III secretory pathway chaperone